MATRILKFTVIDVETASPADWSTICQVGIAVVKSGEIVETWSQLVDPKTDDWRNTRIHGITASMVRGMPTFDEIYPRIRGSFARGGVVSHHSAFDRNAIRKACARHRLPMFQNEWRDSIAIAKRAWRGRQSYSLPIIAEDLGIRYDAHDAGEDAEAAAKLVLRAGAVLGTKRVNDWLRRG